MEDIDSVPSNVQSARQEALLYVFEDNEAVIKMIIKGRSPTMRHVSRTHRVALDWLFDWINLDPKIQIKYIDTKNQLADILTKGNFTRDEWNHLLHSFNISHFSSIERITSTFRWKEAMEIKIPGVRKLRERIDQGDPVSTATERPHLTIFMNNLLKILPQQATQSGMKTMLGLLKRGKLILRCANDRRDPM